MFNQNTQQWANTLFCDAQLMDKIISVCDRESDIAEYLEYKIRNNQRYVVRATQNRKLILDEKLKLEEYTKSMEPSACFYVSVAQKGGRPARTAKVLLSYGNVIFNSNSGTSKRKILSPNIVICQEISAPTGVEPLCWRLYTSEPIDLVENALKIVRYYELRWRVEEFHKAWKSAGTKVESFRHQCKDNLEKMIVITAFVATRLLQIQELVKQPEQAKETSCRSFFSSLEWKLLWTKVESTSLPDTVPSLHWAYYALAKLGKWYDSKRTGRVGWQALWEGWIRLAQIQEGIRLMKPLENEI